MRNLMHIMMLTLVVAFTAACTRVEPGYTGIEVNLHGEDRGVSADNIVTGRVYYNPWTTNIYEFPTFMQQFTWTASQDVDCEAAQWTLGKIRELLLTEERTVGGSA